MVVYAHWGSTCSPNHPVWEHGCSGSKTEAISFSRRVWPTPSVTWSLQFARRKLLKLVTAAIRSSKKEEDGRKEAGRLIKASLSLQLFPKGDWRRAVLLHGYCSLTSLCQAIALGHTFAIHRLASDPHVEFRRTEDWIQERLPVGKQGEDTWVLTLWVIQGFYDSKQGN